MKTFKIIIIGCLIVLLGRLLLYLIAPPKIELVFSRGDTVHGFAQLLEASPKHLIYYNNIKNPRAIPIGTKIRAPMPVIPYLRFRLGLQRTPSLGHRSSTEPLKPLVYNTDRDISGTIFYSPAVEPHPNPKIFNGKHMILGNMFLINPGSDYDFRYRYSFVLDGNKLNVYDFVGDNPLYCPVDRLRGSEYSIKDSLFPEFVSIWNNYQLREKPIVFFKGDL